MKPPYNLESEAVTLANIMTYEEFWAEHGNKLTVQHFYDPTHQIIFKACERIANRGDHADMMMVAEEIEKTGGGVQRQYILDLLDAVDIRNAKSYIKFMTDSMVCRNIMEKADKIRDVAADPSKDYREAVAELETSMRDIMELQADENEPRLMQEIARATLEHLERRFENQDKLLGVSTGIEQLDKDTHGLCGGQLVIVAARPAMGKTVFLNQLIKSAAKVKTGPVIAFSLEMPAEQLASRLFADLGSINADKLRSGKFDRDDFASMTGAYKQLKKLNIHIDDSTGLTVYDMTAKVKRIERKYGKPEMIAIDYLQLINQHNQRQDVQAHIKDVLQALADIGKHYDIPVVILSQLSRGVENRPCKRPIAADLRDSGWIEQYANLIIMLYRDEVYSPDSPDKGTIELIRVKSREGETGMTRAQFIGKYQRICDLPHQFNNTGE